MRPEDKTFLKEPGIDRNENDSNFEKIISTTDTPDKERLKSKKFYSIETAFWCAFDKSQTVVQSFDRFFISQRPIPYRLYGRGQPHGDRSPQERI